MFFHYCILLWISVLIHSIQGLESCNKTSTDIQLCILDVKNYDKSVPAKAQHPYFFVNIINVLGIVELDAKEQSVTLFIILRTEWNDTRIALKNADKKATKWHQIDQKEAQELFFPKIIVRNAKSVGYQKEFASYESPYFWFETPHHFEFQQVMKATIYCSFDFKNFPFDGHECDFIIGLSANAEYNSRLLTTKIKHFDQEANDFGDRIAIQKSILPFTMHVLPIKPFAKYIEGYNYSHAGMKIEFVRNSLGSLLGRFYAPTSIFAILSLISYFIDPQVVPGRLGLLVTLYLIASNVYSSLTAPQQRGFSYIEIWMTGIQFTILLALMEYGIVLALIKFNFKLQKKVFINRSSDKGQQFNDDGHQKAFIKTVDLCTFFAASCFMALFSACYFTIM